jgi:MoaA/NifB/PqqE/SkfB family radical SAM enzyme
MRHSLYWDDFNNRIEETVSAVNNNTGIPVRRVAVFITDKCNLKCKYCNHGVTKNEMSEETFNRIVQTYPNAIIHITGGEPSLVPWLFPYLEKHGDKHKFHLNTNAVIMPPAKHIKRLKISLDSHDATYWNNLVGRTVFNTVVSNIKNSIKHTVTSLTYTMTKDNYRNIPKFIEFVNNEIRGLILGSP